MSKEREDIRQGWYYGKVPEGSGAPKLIHREDGVALSRRRHGATGRVCVTDQTSDGLHRATLMRAVSMLDAGGHALSVVLDGSTAPPSMDDEGTIRMNGGDLARAPSPHHLFELDPDLIKVASRQHTCPPRDATPASKVLCFESLMNTDMPHNDNEISQGVLHMVSVLADSPTEVYFANIKMDIIGEARLT